jgi:hypothetical protein
LVFPSWAKRDKELPENGKLLRALKSQSKYSSIEMHTVCFTSMQFECILYAINIEMPVNLQLIMQECQARK